MPPFSIRDGIVGRYKKQQPGINSQPTADVFSHLGITGGRNEGMGQALKRRERGHRC